MEVSTFQLAPQMALCPPGGATYGTLPWKDPVKQVPFSILLTKAGPQWLISSFLEDLGLGVRLINWTFLEGG